MQTLMLDPGGFKDLLRAYPFFGNMARVAMLGGARSGAARGDLECFFTEGDRQYIIVWSEVQATRTYCGRLLFSPQSGCLEYTIPG